MTQHTPGPWTVEIDNHPDNGRTQIGSPKDFICEMYKGYDHPDIASLTTGREDQTEGEQQANARLIAAAPELLEALEKLSELMSMSDAAFTSVNVNAKKAIKKARFG